MKRLPKNVSLKKASLINASAKYAIVLMNLLFTAVLARLLTPDDYGVVAIVSIFTSLFARISDLGFGTAIIQRVDLTDEDVNHIFSVAAGVSVLLALAFAFAGYPVSSYYGNAAYVQLFWLFSISVFFGALNIIPSAVLMRDKRFISVGIRDVAVNIAGFGIAIVMAFMGFKFYALVMQSIFAAVITCVWNTLASKVRFPRRTSLKPVRSIFKYSLFQYFFNWVNYFETNLDNILVGTYLGSTPLAFYDKAYKLLSYPVYNISGILSPVLHPVLKDYQDRPSVLADKYTHIQKTMSLVAMFVFVACYAASDEIIRVFYGDQWLSSITAFKYLSFSIYPRMMMTTTAAVYCSIGMTKLLFRAGAINAAVTSVFIILGIYYRSIESVALCVSIANWLNMFLTFFIMTRYGFDGRFSKVLKPFLPDLAAMAGTAALLKVAFLKPFGLEPFESLVVKTICAAAIFLGYVLLTRQTEALLVFVPKKMRRKGRKGKL